MHLHGPFSVSTRSFATALLLLAILACTPADAQEERVETNLRLGAEAMHRGKADEAEKFFREVIQLAPQLADGYLDLGLAQLKQGKLPQAVDSLQAALQRNPNAPGGNPYYAGIGVYSFEEQQPRQRADGPRRLRSARDKERDK